MTRIIKVETHPPVDVPICETCNQLDLNFFDPGCTQCWNIITQGTTSPAEIFAILRQWTPQTQQHVYELVKEIFKKGAGINDRDGLTDMTLLHYAAKCAAHGMGDVLKACSTVELLLEKGADIFAKSSWTKMTALHYAVYFNVPDVVEILLKASNAKDVDAICAEIDLGGPLHMAAANLCIEAACVLIKFGSNLKLRDRLKRIPYDCVPDTEMFDSNDNLTGPIIKMKKILHVDRHSWANSSDSSAESIQARVTLQALGLKIGSRVLVGGVKYGNLHFCGQTDFASGLWGGVELDEPIGKNNGSVNGVSYFHCPANFGIFAPIRKITRPGIVAAAPQQLLRPSLALSHRKISTEHITARVDTGLYKVSSTADSMVTNISLNDRVLVAGQRRGVVRFSGRAIFAPGWWFGIELDRAVGKNDGSVNGQRYFTCPPRHGVFAPPSRVVRISSSSGATGKRSPLKKSVSFTSNHDFTLRVGLSVFYNNELGVIRFIGSVHFAEGLWLGVELRSSCGRHDGLVQGHRYFTCRPSRGVLVRPSKVTVRGINGAKLLGIQHQREAEELRR